MSKFGPKTTAALAICLPRYKGVLAKPVATKTFNAKRAASIAMIVLGAIYLLLVSALGWYVWLKFDQLPYGAP